MASGKTWACGDGEGATDKMQDTSTGLKIREIGKTWLVSGLGLAISTSPRTFTTAIYPLPHPAYLRIGSTVP